jgi:DNA-binding response OmpR family regulator
VKAMGGMKVVIVDDDVLLTRTLGILLKQRGYEVEVFNKGVDAIQRFFEELPDVILLNSRLPDCEGCFIARLLEKMDDFNKLLIIFLSVMETDRSKTEGKTNIVFLQKPFDTGKLIELIEGKLKNPSLAVGS